MVVWQLQKGSQTRSQQDGHAIQMYFICYKTILMLIFMHFKNQ